MKIEHVVTGLGGLLLPGLAGAHVGVHADGVVHPHLGMEHLLATLAVVVLAAGVVALRRGG